MNENNQGLTFDQSDVRAKAAVEAVDKFIAGQPPGAVIQAMTREQRLGIAKCVMATLE